MTMHMLPSYFTTTSTRKQKKKTKTKSLIAAEKEHEKFLRRMGIGKSQKTSRSLAQSGSASALGAEGHRFKSYRSDQPVSKPESIHDKDWSPCPKKPTHINTGNHVIGQAYNKGNYQVLSSSEVKDDMTGKRR